MTDTSGALSAVPPGWIPGKSAQSAQYRPPHQLVQLGVMDRSGQFLADVTVSIRSVVSTVTGKNEEASQRKLGS